MGVFYRFVAVSLFVFVFVADLFYDLDEAWYYLLLMIMVLLFEKELPVRALLALWEQTKNESGGIPIKKRLSIDSAYARLPAKNKKLK